MNITGFNPQQLVRRGVFRDLDELDRVMCELDDEDLARRQGRPVVVHWLPSVAFRLRSQESGVRSQDFTQGSRGLGVAHNHAGAGATPAPAPQFTVDGEGTGLNDTRSKRSLASALPPAGYPIEICAWCACERVLQGHGPAPRSNGDITWVSCERHSDTVSPTSQPGHIAGPACPTPAGANPPSLGSPAGFPFSQCAEPFHPVLNPNAGVVPAFPKGRWS